MEPFAFETTTTSVSSSAPEKRVAHLTHQTPPKYLSSSLSTTSTNMENPNPNTPLSSSPGDVSSRVPFRLIGENNSQLKSISSRPFPTSAPIPIRSNVQRKSAYSSPNLSPMLPPSVDIAESPSSGNASIR